MLKSNTVFFLGIIFVVVLIVVYSFSGEEVNQQYEEEITVYRQDKDKMFANGDASPLDRRQKKKFDGLAYFPINPAYRLQAELVRFELQEMVEMPTSQEKNRRYVKYGKLVFRLDGREHELTIFKSTDRLAPNVLFVPFTDGTTGFETYGAGRYLDLEPVKGNALTLDFNMAYNPYCAYNETYDCPIPPKENHLEVDIKAGEKIFETFKKP